MRLNCCRNGPARTVVDYASLDYASLDQDPDEPERDEPARLSRTASLPRAIEASSG